MAYIEQVLQTFAPDGVLAKHNPTYQTRAGQQSMAEAVARAIADGGVLVAEAGTGTGKTFAYLVPALLSGKRVLLSTATKALQDQLFHRDIPHVLESLALPASVALLKGRGSYLCTHRMRQARHEVLSRVQLKLLAQVEKWAQATDSGDLDELADRQALQPMRHWISSTRDNCLGQECPDFKTCHVNRARRNALAADVVVINHHLFFADQSVRASGMAELLPSVNVCIFDEAHQINETGIQFLGRQVSSRRIVDLSHDALAAGFQHARGLHDWQALCSRLERAMQDVRLVASPKPYEQRLRWHDAAPEGVAVPAWDKALDELSDALQSMLDVVDNCTDMSPDFRRLKERCAEQLEVVQAFAAGQQPDPNQVRWVETGRQLRLVQAPLDIAQHMQTMLRSAGGASDRQSRADEQDTAQQRERQHAGNGAKSWIFTSATLGYGGDMRWFTRPCGLYPPDTETTEAPGTANAATAATVEDAEKEATGKADDAAAFPTIELLELASPFAYRQQAQMYVPPTFPPPNTPEHSPSVALLAEAVARRIGGRTLVLTTTSRAMHTIADALRESLEDAGDLEVMMQGEASKQVLLERFHAAAEAGTAAAEAAAGQQNRGMILVATASFWEGIDIPGSALEVVLIDKLPFPPPDDPMVEARSQRIENSGGKAFFQYSLPEAAVALKQGAGRLIRTESDRGVLVLCDVRLLQKGYGKGLLSALPPMRHLPDRQAFSQALHALNTHREQQAQKENGT